MGRRVASGLPAHGDGVKGHWSQSAFANTDLQVKQTQLAVFIADFERPSHEGEMGIVRHRGLRKGGELHADRWIGGHCFAGWRSASAKALNGRHSSVRTWGSFRSAVTHLVRPSRANP